MKPTKPAGAPPHLAGAPPPEPEQLPCPRCSSTNTKFCYYNNYNFSQPRHFCKGCRRYWTHGGTLRDIPVGGGTRKRHRPASIVPPAAPQPEGKVGLVGFGSFTSLLGSGGGPGFVNAFGGFGSGFVNPFQMGGYDVGLVNAWPMQSGGEGGECFALPELAISTPGYCLE